MKELEGYVCTGINDAWKNCNLTVNGTYLPTLPLPHGGFKPALGLFNGRDCKVDLKNGYGMTAYSEASVMKDSTMTVIFDIVQMSDIPGGPLPAGDDYTVCFCSGKFPGCAQAEDYIKPIGVVNVYS